MPVELIGLLEDVEKFEGKTGFGANVTVSTKIGSKTKRIVFMTRNKEMALKLESVLDTNVVIKVTLNQNNFGLRFGDILEISA